MLKPLPHPDNLHLSAAEGWLELGNWREADMELENISPPQRAHPYVLEMRFQICAKAANWKRAVDISRTIIQTLPDNPWGPFHLAYSLHELKRTQEAYDALRPAVEQWPDKHLIHYNLACYACQLGNLDEALDWLKKSIALAGKEDIRKQALSDPDLKTLRVLIRQL